jgi:TrmH family RNA methyltransferase
MPKAETIASPANPLLKEVRRAIARGSRTEAGCWVAESFHLLDEALAAGLGTPAVLAAESAREAVETRLRGRRRARLVTLADRLFQNVAGTQSSQGVIALVEPPVWTIDRLLEGAALLLVLDGVQDPGNAGAVARAAEAFGATGVIFLKGAASPYHPKTLRASAGSLFRIPFVHGLEPAAARAALEGRVRIYAGLPARAGSRTLPIGEADLRARCALVIGSEGQGAGEEMRRASTGVTIPTAGVESLNAAAAAAVMLYEARRQRTAAP